MKRLIISRKRAVQINEKKKRSESNTLRRNAKGRVSLSLFFNFKMQNLRRFRNVSIFYIFLSRYYGNEFVQNLRDATCRCRKHIEELDTTALIVSTPQFCLYTSYIQYLISYHE